MIPTLWLAAKNKDELLISKIDRQNFFSPLVRTAYFQETDFGWDRQTVREFSNLIAIYQFKHRAPNHLKVANDYQNVEFESAKRNSFLVTKPINNVPFGHLLIAIASMNKGLGKLLVNEGKIAADLEANWAVVAEAIQNILRREGYPKPYEALKALTRTNSAITASSIADFIDTLAVNDTVKAELKQITPSNYIGQVRS